MSTIPADPSCITPAWLSDALSARHPGVRVASVEVLDSTERTNSHLRLALDYERAAGAPATIFCKLPPSDPAHRARIGAGGMGLREVRAYTDVTPSLSMRVPACHFAAAGEGGAFAMLLEDLVASGGRVSDGSWAISGSLAPAAVADLAELHVRHEDPERFAAVAPWAAHRRGKAPDFVIETLLHVIETCRDRLSDAYLEVARLYVDHHETIDAAWDGGPQTLIHGDAHIGNLFLDGDRVGFLDWGMARIGTPMRDLSFFLTMGMEPGDRRRDERDLIRHYLDVRGRLGGRALSFDDAWLAHRLHAGYTVIASFLSLVPPYDTESRRMFTTHFRARAMAALDDLDTVGALQALVAS